MNGVVISENLAVTILNYLGHRPYVEVAGMIAGIQQAAQPQPPVVPAHPPAKDVENG